MKRLIDYFKGIIGKIFTSEDSKYIVCDVYHENYSPERMLYSREYLKKFNPEIMDINGQQKLVITIDKDLDYNILYDYEYKQNIMAEINIISDNNIDSRISGYVFFS